MQSAEDQVTGETGVSRDRRRLEIANFTDHDDVRRLAQDGAERGGKGHPDLGIYLYLVDPVHLILDRLLDRDDLAIGFVDVIETGVERTRLSRAGRAGDEQNAVWRPQESLENFLIVAQETEFGQTEKQARFIEQPHDHALAVVGRQWSRRADRSISFPSSPGCDRPAGDAFPRCSSSRS